jgi:energy-coupling factor transport system ATP-binding protein
MGIQIKDVSYRYPTAEVRAGSTRGVWALSHIDLNIEDGELVVILGRNGSGKSTLCTLMNGLIPQFFKGQMRGEVLVNGRKTTEVEVTEMVKEIGVVFQNPFDQLTGAASTVFDEVAIGPENLGLPREESIARIKQALEEAGITELADRSPFQLSGGQQQRVAVASILAMRPGIMVLDEPTSQLDPVGTDEVFEVINRLHRQGMTIILAEHKVDAIAALADRIVVLKDGFIELVGTPREILTNPTLESLGVLPPRYTELAIQLSKAGIWKSDFPLSIQEAKQSLMEILDGNHTG